MSERRSVPSRSVGLATVLRTLVHLRPGQALAQLRHALFGLRTPRRFSGTPPTLVMDRPATEFLSPPAHVKRLTTTRIEMLGTAFELGEPIAWQSDLGGPLFAYHLHQHEVLRLAEFSPRARAEFLRDWIRHHPAGVGWDPHPISLRLLCWGKLLATPGLLGNDADLRQEMMRSMASQAETLRHGLEDRLQANHLLSNLIALVSVGLLFKGPASAVWRSSSEALVRQLDCQIRPDGGHEERSPMYHALLLENLLDLLNLCRSGFASVPAELEAELSEVLSRMLSALEVMTHPDGRISLFGDSAFDVAASPESLRGYAARLGISPPLSSGSRHLPQTGYLRLQAADFTLIASVAGPSPVHQPGHAHCDALAFELSAGGHRLVTDTGLFEYRPGRRRDLARRTSSHSTLVFDGAEQAEIWSAHRVGGRPIVGLTAWDEKGSAEAICRGWSKAAPLHRRFFSVADRIVSILDRVEGVCREIRFCLPIDPAWHVELASGRAQATRDETASAVEIELADRFEWTLERAAYYPTFGREIERFVLVGLAEGSDSEDWGEVTTRFRWLA
ncbi:MAG: heparinase II/III family protein [Myxococcota bacterium]